MIDVQQVALFDYSVLDTQTREFVQERTENIHAHLNNLGNSSIAIGFDLMEVKETIPHGQFAVWVQSEFGMTPRTAQRFMAIAQRFGTNATISSHLGWSILSELVSASDTIVEMVETKQIPATISAIREVKQAEKQAEPERISLADIFDPVAQTIPTAHLPKTPDHLQGNGNMVATFSGTYSQRLYGLSQNAGGGIIEIEEEQEKTEQDRYMTAVDTGTVDLYYDDLRREAFKRDEEERAKEKRDAHVMQVMGSSDSPEWFTPQEIVRLSIELLGEIDLDPCSNSHASPSVPARILYTKEDNGLSHPWQDKVYLNPPYGGEIPQWVAKLIASYSQGAVTEAVALLPARIDTQWFQPLYEEADCLMCHVRGRIQFENSPHHAPFPCVIAYLGKRGNDFIKVFRHKGPIMRRVG